MTEGLEHRLEGIEILRLVIDDQDGPLPRAGLLIDGCVAWGCIGHGGQEGTAG
jgi:hypothetical protein